MEFKKTKINYIDIFFAIFHFFIILFSYFSLPSFIAYSSSAISVSGFSLSIMMYLFIKNNPFYIYYSFGVLIIGALFLILNYPFYLSGLMLDPFYFGGLFDLWTIFLIIFVILEGIYFYSLIGRNRSNPSLVMWGGLHILDYYKDPYTHEDKLEILKQKEKLKKEYKSRKNIILSMILNTTFIVLVILSFLF